MNGFYRQLFSRMAAAHPEHEFVFIDEAMNNLSGDPPNLRRERLSAIANPLLRQYRNDVKLPSLLKKINAGVFVSAGNCSSKIKIPQCLIADDGLINQKKFLKRLEKISLLIVLSAKARQQVEKANKTFSGKTEVIYPAASDLFAPVDMQTKEKIKEQYSRGKEYFFCRVFRNDDLLIDLLKAFSFFKKRQQSAMKLILAAHFSFPETFTKALATYKYREDVVPVHNVNEKESALLTASAYAAIIPFPGEEAAITIAEAMQCGVPVIIPENSAATEPAGDAILYADMKNPKDAGEKLMRLYTDEDLRNNMIEKGKNIAATNSLQNAAETLFRAIASAVR